MSSYSDLQRGAPVNPDAPSPPYATTQGDRRSYQHESSPNLQQRPIPATQQQAQQQQPPLPRKSMFDFISPFDALSSTLTGSIKKKPVPVQAPSVSSGPEESGWANLSDPRRQAVYFEAGIPNPPAYESYLGGSASTRSGASPTHNETQGKILLEQLMSGNPPMSSYSDPQRGAPVNPDAPSPPWSTRAPHRPRSPRSPSPIVRRVRVPRPRKRTRSVLPSAWSSRPQASRGAPRLLEMGMETTDGTRKVRLGHVEMSQAKGNKNNVQSPSPQAQNIVFDVSQSLDEIQASRDAVKSTVIALVKRDPVFLSGTTIGATHWLAYAMTRRRVRVISRSSGDRTLLQLPPGTFQTSSSVSDMAVYGNRLAGVTSDDGFVVWELPEVITDDVAGQLLLCVPPVGSESASDALHSVKWHPKEPDTLAVASQSKVYLIDLTNIHSLHGQPVQQLDLPHISQVFSIPAPLLVGFDFDILHYALATISEDSSLIIWNIHDKSPYTTHKIRGEDVPSSLTYGGKTERFSSSFP
ncbi:hypothetical protein B0H14DRAFT_2556978 [Mycena olivaceomarginata]|nr:hypothetical protein B0H14DRAFT_2556978 [Mycena olivaceomarginata]